MFYLSDIREVTDLLPLPTETGAETHGSSVATCHLKHRRIYLRHVKGKNVCISSPDLKPSFMCFRELSE